MTGFPDVKETHILGKVYTVNPCPFTFSCFCITSEDHFCRLWKVIFAASFLRLGLLEDGNQYH